MRLSPDAYIDSVNHGGCEVKITGLAATLANQLSEEMITWKALACCCSIGEGCDRRSSGECYAARVESARLIHLAMSAEPAPMVKSERMRRSRETEWSPASILATRDWLDPN